MERVEDGSVQALGTTFKVPTNRTALPILADNRIVNGCDYNKNGWVYVDGKRIKKWFSRCYSPEESSISALIWLPVLDDVAKLEARYWKILGKVKKFYREHWKIYYDRIIEAGKAHAKPTHKYTGDLHWWEYKRYNHFDGHSALSFDWVEEPKEPVNLELGQEYYHIDRKITRYYQYLGMFQVVLSQAISKYLKKYHKVEHPGITLRFEINGRNYWYTSAYVGHSLEWIKQSWSEGKLKEIKL